MNEQELSGRMQILRTDIEAARTQGISVFHHIAIPTTLEDGSYDTDLFEFLKAHTKAYLTDVGFKVSDWKKIPVDENQAVSPEELAVVWSKEGEKAAKKEGFKF